MNREKARELTAAGWECSVDKIRRQLGFRPFVSLSEGIASTYQWYCEHGWVRPVAREEEGDTTAVGASQR